MNSYKLKIELLSDLCVADGGVYNSSIDTDICQDKYGLPYIPAKRIRGCLRECAQELKDWGSEIEPSILFGQGGDKGKAGKVRISDAYLLNYESIIQEIKNGSPIIYHPQNVLQNYSYTRTQTSIYTKKDGVKDEPGKEDGVAIKNSLRTIRVANKGLIFEAEVNLIDENQKENLEKCCKLLRNMGLARTRGLGEIKAILEPAVSKNTVNNHNEYNGESVLKYKISLLEPMICKSINGGESNSYDYIEGSKIIGLLAKALNDDEKLKDILADDELVFSNAYIEKNGTRMVEVPAYLYSIKNNKTNYINRLVYVDQDNDKTLRQINGMKHCYVSLKNGILDKTSVEMEERYHHSRPEDKSIGRATDKGESKFYQISSITEGQVFAGFIEGKPETIKKVYDELSEIGICNIGYGSMSEYGKCEIAIEPKESESLTKCKGKEFVVSLVSPAIVYNNHAMYSTNYDDLVEEILCTMGLDKSYMDKIDQPATKRFMKYTNLGGYNVTWNARKPVISAFDKGTAIKIVFKEDVTVNTGKCVFIGERSQEGYGECIIEELSVNNDETAWMIKKSDGQTASKEFKCGGLGKDICLKLFNDYIQMKALSIIKENKKLCVENNRSIVSNMLLMCSEMDTMDKINAAVKDRFGKSGANKKQKDEIAKNILNAVSKNSADITAEFCSSIGVNKDIIDLSQDNIQLRLLKALLVEIKYKIRTVKGGKANE